jgi:hypothetical protein
VVSGKASVAVRASIPDRTFDLVVDGTLVAIPRTPAICAFVRLALGRGARGTRFLVLSTHRRPKRSLAKCAGSRRAWYSYRCGDCGWSRSRAELPLRS